MLVAVLLIYIAVVFAAGRWGVKTDADAFFRAGGRARWTMVGFGMIGASISGVSLLSVPAMVRESGWSYLQLCVGFVPGYLIVAFVLLPLYYRLRLVSIYSYLGLRFGRQAERTGAFFFFISKTVGAAARLMAVCLVFETVFGWDFRLTAALVVASVFLYTLRGGIAALVRTDCLQTACLLAAVGALIVAAAAALRLNAAEAAEYVARSPMSDLFAPRTPDAVVDAGRCVRQVLSGAFIVVVMTGLDQDMMQKNLACRTLSEARREMCLYGLAFVPVNALLLALGVLLWGVCSAQSLIPPAAADALVPFVAGGGHLGRAAELAFALGVSAAALSSADSALTSLTTTCCLNFFGGNLAPRRRYAVHALAAAILLLAMLLLHAVSSRSLLDLIYTLCGYTYGPLLGLFALGLFTRLRPPGAAVAPVAVASVTLSYALGRAFSLGYELLLLNGALTFALLAFFALCNGRKTPAPHDKRSA